MKKSLILTIALLALAGLSSYAQKTTTMQYNRERVYTTETKVKKVWYQGELTAGFGYSGSLSAKVNVGDEESASWKGNGGAVLQPSITTVQGIRITQWFFLGIGASFIYYSPSWVDEGIVEDKFAFDQCYRLYYDDNVIYDQENCLLPVFLNVKGYYPITDRFSLYATVSAGYPITAIGIAEIHQWGRYYGEYGVGLNYRKFNLSLGLQQLEMNSRTENSGGMEINSKMTQLSFFFKIGVKW